MFNYREGSKISYSPLGGGTRTGIVIEKSDDIKNDEPGFVLQEDTEKLGWGYDSQITAVIKF